MFALFWAYELETVREASGLDLRSAVPFFLAPHGTSFAELPFFAS